MSEILTTFLITALFVQYPLLPTMVVAGLFLLDQNYNNDELTKEQAEEKTLKDIFLNWLAITLGASILIAVMKFFI